MRGSHEIAEQQSADVRGSNPVLASQGGIPERYQKKESGLGTTVPSTAQISRFSENLSQDLGRAGASGLDGLHNSMSTEQLKMGQWPSGEEPSGPGSRVLEHQRSSRRYLANQSSSLQSRHNMHFEEVRPVRPTKDAARPSADGSTNYTELLVERMANRGMIDGEAQTSWSRPQLTGLGPLSTDRVADMGQRASHSGDVRRGAPHPHPSARSMTRAMLDHMLGSDGGSHLGSRADVPHSFSGTQNLEQQGAAAVAAAAAAPGPSSALSPHAAPSRVPGSRSMRRSAHVLLPEPDQAPEQTTDSPEAAPNGRRSLGRTVSLPSSAHMRRHSALSPRTNNNSQPQLGDWEEEQEGAGGAGTVVHVPYSPQWNSMSQSQLQAGPTKRGRERQLSHSAAILDSTFTGRVALGRGLLCIATRSWDQWSSSRLCIHAPGASMPACSVCACASGARNSVSQPRDPALAPPPAEDLLRPSPTGTQTLWSGTHSQSQWNTTQNLQTHMGSSLSAAQHTNVMLSTSVNTELFSTGTNIHVPAPLSTASQLPPVSESAAVVLGPGAVGSSTSFLMPSTSRHVSTSNIPAHLHNSLHGSLHMGSSFTMRAHPARSSRGSLAFDQLLQTHEELLMSNASASAMVSPGAVALSKPSLADLHEHEQAMAVERSGGSMVVSGSGSRGGRSRRPPPRLPSRRVVSLLATQMAASAGGAPPAMGVPSQLGSQQHVALPAHSSAQQLVAAPPGSNHSSLEQGATGIEGLHSPSTQSGRSTFSTGNPLLNSSGSTRMQKIAAQAAAILGAAGTSALQNKVAPQSAPDALAALPGIVPQVVPPHVTGVQRAGSRRSLDAPQPTRLSRNTVNREDTLEGTAAEGNLAARMVAAQGHVTAAAAGFAPASGLGPSRAASPALSHPSPGMRSSGSSQPSPPLRRPSSGHGTPSPHYAALAASTGEQLSISSSRVSRPSVSFQMPPVPVLKRSAAQVPTITGPDDRFCLLDPPSDTGIGAGILVRPSPASLTTASPAPRKSVAFADEPAPSKLQGAASQGSVQPSPELLGSAIRTSDRASRSSAKRRASFKGVTAVYGGEQVGVVRRSASMSAPTEQAGLGTGVGTDEEAEGGRSPKLSSPETRLSRLDRPSLRRTVSFKGTLPGAESSSGTHATASPDLEKVIATALGVASSLRRISMAGGSSARASQNPPSRRPSIGSMLGTMGSPPLQAEPSSMGDLGARTSVGAQRARSKSMAGYLEPAQESARASPRLSTSFTWKRHLEAPPGGWSKRDSGGPFHGRTSDRTMGRMSEFEALRFAATLGLGTAAAQRSRPGSSNTMSAGGNSANGVGPAVAAAAAGMQRGQTLDEVWADIMGVNGRVTSPGLSTEPSSMSRLRSTTKSVAEGLVGRLPSAHSVASRVPSSHSLASRVPSASLGLPYKLPSVQALAAAEQQRQEEEEMEEARAAGVEGAEQMDAEELQEIGAEDGVLDASAIESVHAQPAMSYSWHEIVLKQVVDPATKG